MGFGVWILGFGVWGVEFRVWGLGLGFTPGSLVKGIKGVDMDPHMRTIFTIIVIF